MIYLKKLKAKVKDLFSLDFLDPMRIFDDDPNYGIISINVYSKKDKEMENPKLTLISNDVDSAQK